MTKRRLANQTAEASAWRNRPNAALVTMQIEAMQVVLRRMRASRTIVLDPITNEKLGKIAEK